MLEKVLTDDIVKKLAKQHGIKIKDAKLLVKFVNRRLKKAVLEGNEIRISNIATITFNKKRYLDFIEKKSYGRNDSNSRI